MEVDPPQSPLADGRPARQMIEGRSAYVEGELSVVPSHHRMATRGGDIVVHTGRSYLDAHYDLNSEGPDFTRNQGGFENLPGPLGPN